MLTCVYQDDNIISMRQFYYHGSAWKVLMKLPNNTRNRIQAKVETLASNPDALANNITALKGTCYHRLRVGNWLIKYMDSETVIDILEIFPRGKDYKA